MRACHRRLASGTLIRIVLMVFILSSVVAVQPGVSRAQDVEPTATEIATETAAPTETPTPVPTSTPEPTNTPEPTSTQPTDTPEPASTVEPTESPESTTPPPSTSTPLPTSSPTDTPPPTATSTPAAGAAATTGTTKIKSVDKNGALLLHAKYDIYRDAGGGTLGTYRVTTVDGDDDGYAVFTLLAGNYVAVEVSQRPGFGLADNTRFTVEAGVTKTITVIHKPLSRLIIDAKEQNTLNPIAGYCYDLIPQNQPYGVTRSACDADDGATDGSTVFNGIDLYTFQIHERKLVGDYLRAANQNFSVVALDTTYHKAITHVVGGRIDVRATDEGTPVPGLCVRVNAVFYDGTRAFAHQSKCDADDGATDGLASLRGIPTGAYEVLSYSLLPGYLPTGPVDVQVTNGQTTQLDIPLQAAGHLTINIINELGEPLPGSCLTIRADAGPDTWGDYGASLCAAFGSETDGTIGPFSIFPGNYRIWQDPGPSATPPGYAPIGSIPFVMTLSDSTVTVQYGLGATIVMHVNDESNNPLAGACFDINYGAGGTLASVCDAADGSADGTATFRGLAPGDYQLVQKSAAALYSGAPPQAFTIAGSETKTIDLVNLPFGAILIHTQTPALGPLPGACFSAFATAGGQGTEKFFVACDADDGTSDGDVRIRVPEGTHTVGETTVPSGYVQAEDVHGVVVTSGATTEITIVNPTPSTLAIHAKEGWDTPIKGLCWWFNSDLHCDNTDGTSDGVTHLDNLRGGAYSVVLYGDAPSGTINPGTIPVNVEWMSANETTVVFHRPAPKLSIGSILNGISPTSIEVYFKADQPIHGRIDYGTSNSLGQSALGSPAFSTQKTITITGLTPDKTYYLRVHIENGNGTFDEQIFTVRTAKSTATGKVVVTKKKSDGTSLPGACFDVYRDAGGGALGDFVASSCDSFEADGNNGKITLAGLSAGAYVLAEFYAPVRYQLAKQVLFTITAGQTKQLTVIDYGGGAVVHVASRVTGGALLKGSCFAIYKSRGGTVGAYVTSVCDYLDGEDGMSNFSGIPAGTYFLWEYYVPTGFIRDPILQFTINPDQQSKSITYYNRKVTDNGNIVITSIDSLDRPVPGACYALFRTYSSGALGAFVKESCDWSDGYEDGKTYFTGITGGMYAAVEYVAPKGFIAGKKTTITKVSGQLASKRIRQVAGGVAVNVTTLKGSTTSKAAGACYGLFRYSSGQWQYVTDACDAWDGANDGVTRIRGVQAGTYRLYQVVTPSGYSTPAYVTITVGSTTKSVTVRMYPR